MKWLNKRYLIYGSLILGIFGGASVYIYSKEKKEESKIVIKYVDPFEYFHQMDKSFFDDNFFSEPKLLESSFKIDIKENEKEYLVEAELPGVKKEDIKINYANEYLIISTSTGMSTEENKENYIKEERNFSEMTRSFYLPNVKKEEIKAKLENGVLKLNLIKGEKTNKDTSIKIE